MRVTLLSGLLLTLAAVLLVGAGSALDAGLGPVALAGLCAGAAVALVPDHGLPARLAGFGVGLVLVWGAYAARAALLPDSTAGRAVAIGLVVALAVLATAALRLPLWSALLGAGTLAGTYEAGYTTAPAEVATTSLAAVTALLVAVLVGVLAAAAGEVLETLVGRAGDAARAARAQEAGR